MPEYNMPLLKRAARLGLPPFEGDAHIIAWANGLDVEAMLSGGTSRYLPLRQHFVRETTPDRYRLVEDGVDHLAVHTCECECLCLECIGLLVECGQCQCDSRELATIPRELTARQMVACGDDSVRLVEVAIGQSTNGWTIRDFRTVQYALFRQLGLGDSPLSDDSG